MPAFYLNVAGGLGNRLLALSSGIRLAANSGRSLVVNWSLGEDCAAPFDRLFDRPLDGAALGLAGFEVTSDPNWYGARPFKQANCASGECFGNRVVDLAATNDDVALDACITLLQPGEENSSDLPVDRAGLEMGRAFSFLKPCAEVLDIVGGIGAAMGGNTLGVHMRRSYDPGMGSVAQVDGLRAFDKITDDMYLRFSSIVMDRSEARHDNVFICTNRPSSAARYEANSPLPCIEYGKRSTDNGADVAAVQDALVDMICLSRCESVLRIKCSSFSYIAALMGPVPMHSVYYNEDVSHVSLWRAVFGERSDEIYDGRVEGGRLIA